MYRGVSVLYFNAPLSDIPIFSKISEPQVKPTKWPTVLFTTIVFQDQPQGYILLHFLKLVSVLSLSKMLVEFFLTGIFYHVWEKFQVYVVRILRKYIGHKSRHFYSYSVPYSKMQAELTAEVVGENYDLLYQNSFRKYEDHLELQVIYILYDLQWLVKFCK